MHPCLQLIILSISQVDNNFLIKSMEHNSKYPLGYNYSQNVDTSDMPDNIHYFLVLPFNPNLAKEQKYQKKQTEVHILTYENDNMTFADLIKQYKLLNPAFKNQEITFTTENYQHISHEHTVKLYKTLTNKRNINGMILCVHTQQQALLESNLPFYVNECCVNTYNKNLIKTSILSLCCQIPLKEPQTIKKNGKEQTKFKQKKIYLFIDVSLSDSGSALKKELIKKLNLQYGKQFKKQHIASVTIDRKMQVNEEVSLYAQGITNETHLALFLTNNSIKLTKKVNTNYKRHLVIFKEGDKDQELFEYEQMVHLTFQQFYDTYLKLEESKEKDAIYCLKIMDFIIQPNDSMGKIDYYFRFVGQATPAIFVGRVVNQKMLFYKMMPEISVSKPFNVNQLKIPKEQATKREVFRDIVRQKAKTARHEPLKVEQNLEPIMLYTSDLRYRDQEDQQRVVYSSLNSFLRDSMVLSLEPKEYESNWKYRYSSVLLKQLAHIQRFKGKVYRGQTYDLKASIGQIITFKQFTSTSKKYEKALAFANQPSKPSGVIYEMEIESGFPIKQYSHYPDEDEVLLQPFTEFKVTKIDNKTIGNKKYKIYSFKQLLTPKKLPPVCANFIVWIDNTPTEGRNIFDFLIYQQTTLLIQMKSTKELIQWLKKHQELLTDRTANIVFLTNMTRKEENGLDQEAGIKAIKQLRKYSQSIPICLYIGDVKRANEKLAKNNVSRANLAVINTANEVMGFLLDKLVCNKQ